jgi:hypothetical protein
MSEENKVINSREDLLEVVERRIPSKEVEKIIPDSGPVFLKFLHLGCFCEICFDNIDGDHLDPTRLLKFTFPFPKDERHLIQSVGEAQRQLREIFESPESKVEHYISDLKDVISDLKYQVSDIESYIDSVEESIRDLEKIEYKKQEGEEK